MKDALPNKSNYEKIGFISIDGEGKIKTTNSAAAEIIGVDLNKAPSHNFTEFLFDKDIPKFYRHLNFSKEYSDQTTGENYLLNRSKSKKIIKIIIVPNEGNFNLILESISQRVRTKDILNESEKQFRLMADNSPVMIWMTDENNQLEYMNNMKLEFLGKKFSELTIEGWIETRHPDDREKFLNALIAAAKKKKIFSIEVRVKDRNGNYRWLLDSAAPRFTEEGKFSGFIGSGVDITERKKTEDILNESEKQFRLMADNSPVMIWMTDESNNLEYMNKTKLKFLGKKFSELTVEGWMATRHPDDRRKFMDELIDAAREKRNFSIEMRVRDKDGNYRWLLDSAAPRFNEEGKFIGFIGSGVDITREKNFRSELQVTLSEKEILLKEIHHRVKNNLQIISSLLNLQSLNIKDKKIHQLYKTSMDRIRAMAILHEKLCRLENISKINLTEYISDLVTNLKKAYNPSKKIELNMNIIEADLDLDLSLNIGLILNELISNSLKYAFKGRKKGKINISVLNGEKDHLILIVNDNGVGLPENFDSNQNTLGLSLVRAFTEQHNGSLEIHSNGFTEFKIHLKK